MLLPNGQGCGLDSSPRIIGLDKFPNLFESLVLRVDFLPRYCQTRSHLHPMAPGMMTAPRVPAAILQGVTGKNTHLLQAFVREPQYSSICDKLREIFVAGNEVHHDIRCHKIFNIGEVWLLERQERLRSLGALLGLLQQRPDLCLHCQLDALQQQMSPTNLVREGLEALTGVCLSALGTARSTRSSKSA